MPQRINRRPLLDTRSDSEFEDDLEVEPDDPTVAVPDEKPFLKLRIPRDKYHLAYIVFYLLGVNTLIPWSFFVTADDYWMYKFRHVHENNTGHLNYTHAENLEKRNDLQASFISYLSVASALPNTVFLIINAFISKKVSLRLRMVGSQCLILLLFLITTALVYINTDEWQTAFLILTLTSVALINAASAIFGGSLLGIVGKFSPRYITAMSGGQALGGIFTAIAEICSLWIGASPVVSGLLYFIIGDIMLLASLIAYVLLERAAFFKHHMFEKSSDRLCINSEEPCDDFQTTLNSEVGFSRSLNRTSDQRVSYIRILQRVWKHGISIFLVFFVSLSVYPAVTVLVESQFKGEGHAWNDVYFVPVVTYLIFSTGDYVGRLLAGKFQWPGGNPWKAVMLSLLRALFIPTFMVCNAQPRHHLPVYIHSDIAYIVLTIIFAITNGYLCSIAFIFAPTVVDAHEKEIASAIIGAFLGIGLSFGSALSLVMVKLL